MNKLIAYIRGLFAEVKVIEICRGWATIMINGSMVKQTFTKEAIDDIEQKNDVDLILEFSKGVSDAFYKQSNILVSPKKIAKAITSSKRINLTPKLSQI